MISRRETIYGLAAQPLLTRSLTTLVGSSLLAAPAIAQEDAPVDAIEDLEYPSSDAINPVQQFGASEPTQQERDKARAIFSQAPMGPRPIDVASYFVERYGAADPDSISQWPNTKAWNPLVVEFFRATSYRAENDMVPWCAAFVNWCLRRTNRAGSGSGASQSFLDPRAFEKTDKPKIGDLAVWTCYDQGNSVGLGHVAFVNSQPESRYVSVLGGNQTNGPRSMICRKKYPLFEIPMTRTVNGKRTPVIFKFNTYVSIV